ncbi:hypothetical protein JG687_00003248 [Phytophthora cactorum]|uniref:HECT-type E3 ubiquitin transferase n=2 Tax=Phytophthora cactorum TaxID=29920 RepID=A0A8T1US61_9STRA|nr:hypothetical protein JG687_00003248 [Phytophthora cactorum]
MTAGLAVLVALSVLLFVGAIVMLLFFCRRIQVQRERESLVFIQEPTDVYREELNDSFMEQALDSNLSIGYIRVRDSLGRLVLNESDVVATDFHYRINILDGAGSSELIMNLEGVHNLPFPDKIRWFSTEIHRLWLPWESGHAELVRWRVVFDGEPALDAGGVMREWFTLLFAELFDPGFGLFVSTVGDERSYWINASSDLLLGEEEHLAYFEFAGRLVGKAILEEHLMPVHLALPFLKHILGVPISFSDLQFLDDEIYNSALMVKKIDDIEPLCLDFTATRIVDGKPEIVELVEGGANIDVTRENRSRYLDALFKYHVLGSVSDQLLSFLTALYDVVPEGLLKLFDYQELELLMCGVPSIDVEDWKKHTDFKFFTHNFPTELELNNIEWFWEVVEDMRNEDRVRLLQFATGTSRVPAQGFKGLISSDGRVRRFNVAFAGANQSFLFPKAHTCFNRLDLPIYNSKVVLAEYVNLIVQMDITGFTIEKRAKASPLSDQEDFSLDHVVANVKKAAVEHAHLPETVETRLFEQDATVSYLTTDRKSWVYHVPRWYWHVFKHAKPDDLRVADEDAEGSPLTWSTLFKRAWEAHPKEHDTIMMFGKPAKLPRFQQLCGEMGSYRYSGKTFEAQKKYPPGLRHAVKEMQRIVEDPTTQHTRLTGGLVNWYENGDHYIGPHADDERDMIACSPIVALSLGATRRFVFTKKTSKSAPQGDEAVARMELQMEDGDLMVMGGTTQRTHKHAVPKMSRCREPRISVTLRCFL